MVKYVLPKVQQLFIMVLTEICFASSLILWDRWKRLTKLRCCSDNSFILVELCESHTGSHISSTTLLSRDRMTPLAWKRRLLNQLSSHLRKATNRDLRMELRIFLDCVSDTIFFKETQIFAGFAYICRKKSRHR